MHDPSKARLTFMANPELRIVVIRPIGRMTARAFIDQLFENYASVDQPWNYGRLNDFRRFEGYLSEADLQEIADRWKALAAGHDYHAHVAVVSNDAFARVRVPSVAPMFPNETICLFSDFHEAMGWLAANDRTKYLASLGPLPSPRCGGGPIVVE